MEDPFSITFPNGNVAQAVRLEPADDARGALTRIGVEPHGRSLVLIGGAGKMTEADLNALRSIFTDALCPLAERVDAAIVDGGTDAGVMALMGQARATTHSAFPLIGVCAVGTVFAPGDPPPRPDAAPLEPNHTHFILVPGDNWGDDSPWLPKVARTVSEGRSATVLVNGGDIAWQDAEGSAEEGNPVVTVAGSGRTADALAAAVRGEREDPRAERLIASELVSVAELSAGPQQLTAAIERALS